MLAFAVLAGYGITILLSKYDPKKYLIIALIGGFIIFEYLCVPFAVCPVNQPEFYQKIGQDNEQYALVEVPITASYGAGVNLMFYQALHEKPVVGGQVARMPSNARDFEMNTPLIRELTFSLPPDRDIINEKVTAVGNSVLQYFNIRYVILHKGFLSHEQLQDSEILLQNCSLQNVYEDDMMVVYEQNKSEPFQQFSTLGNGWYNLENWGGIPTRWMSLNASILVFSEYDHNTTMSLRVSGFNGQKAISIFTPDQNRSQVIIPAESSIIRIPVTIHPGKNTIVLNSTDGCQKPSDIEALQSKDSRCLSIAIQNISFS